MTNCKSKKNKKNVKLKFGDSEKEENEIDDSSIEDGQLLTDDSDQENTVAPEQAARETTEVATNAAVEATLTTEALDKAASNTAVQKESGSSTNNTAQTVSQTAVVKRTGSNNQVITAVENTTEVETATDADAEHTKQTNNIQQPPTIAEHPKITPETLQNESTVKRATLYVGNISTDTTTEDVIQLFGLSTTKYLREQTSVQLVFNSKSRYKGYAYLHIPSHIAEEIMKLDGFEFKSRKLSIQKAINPSSHHKTDKSIIP